MGQDQPRFPSRPETCSDVLKTYGPHRSLRRTIRLPAAASLASLPKILQSPLYRKSTYVENILMARRPNSSAQTLKLLDALLARPGDWHYGYDLSKATSLKSGTLYPQLIRLEAIGWLEARWEEAPQPGKLARHMYHLTARGLQEAPAVLQAAGSESTPQPARPAAEGASS